MRIAVEAWSPDYGSALELGEPDEVSVEKVDTACELQQWTPITPRAGAPPQLPIAFVDGTRRIDARVFVMNGEGGATPGVAGTVGVGAVVCELNGNGRRAKCAEVEITRLLAVGDGLSQGLSAGPGLEYQGLPVPGQSTDRLVDEVHNSMRAREAKVAELLADRDHLVFADGPLAVVDPGPRSIIGFIKAHARRYLPPDEEAVLTRLDCGQRTPIFAFGELRARYSWYVRLCAPEPDMHGWFGIARCEVPAALPLERVMEMADLSGRLLPGFASRPFWDSRAPQNLVPIAGLERRLRHLMGERELVYRMIRSAAKRVGEGDVDV
ncbi:MAG: hypothetical protein QOH48_1568 [Actinomycetota bacterium]|jgi:hypothetical protein|nr:hypothetical protein [Actinomycetota bacterium]